MLEKGRGGTRNAFGLLKRTSLDVCDIGILSSRVSDIFNIILLLMMMFFLQLIKYIHTQ